MRQVEWKLIEMPLPRLQMMGRTYDPFIYEINWNDAVRRRDAELAGGHRAELETCPVPKCPRSDALTGTGSLLLCCHARCCRPDVLTAMPTVLRSGPYRVYFVSHDLEEPTHVHVDRDDQSAKYWLAPVALARNIAARGLE